MQVKAKDFMGTKAFKTYHGAGKSGTANLALVLAKAKVLKLSDYRSVFPVGPYSLCAVLAVPVRRTKFA